MVWDAGAFMKIAIGIFFLAFGAGTAYALFRLASVLKGLTLVVNEVAGEVQPLLTRAETTLDRVNAEIDQVEQITGSAAEMMKVAEKTTTGVYGAVSKPLKRASGLATGVRVGFTSFLSGKERED